MDIKECMELLNRDATLIREDDTLVSATGAKRRNVGKTHYEDLPLDLLDGAADVMHMGKAKYGAENFRKGFDPVDTLGSILRHVSQLQRAVCTEDKDGSKGHLIDAESGKAHIHHAITSLLIAVDSMRKAGFKV